MSLLGKTLLAVALLAAAAAGGVAWLGYREDAGPAASTVSADQGAAIERGRYLAAVGNCMGCHTAAGGKPYAGGREIDTPFGRFYGPNLTPDAEHGLGRWSAADFWRALHNGKAPDGSLLYPAFPYPSYRNVSRADADALFAYLHSLEPVAQANRSHRLDFPYDQRWLLAAWRALYFRHDPARDAAGQSQQLVRGSYLVQGVAHCAECHTPRNRWGAMDAQRSLAGALIPGQSWYAPPLTGDSVTGLGQWTADDIVSLLKTGVARQSVASGPMAEAVHLGFQHAKDDDLAAMAAYLKSLPAAGTDAAAAGARASDALLQTGGKLYEKYCAQCHQSQGEGRSPAWPPLAGNVSVVAASPVNVIHMVLAGGFAPNTGGNAQPHGMPPFGQVLNDQDVAALATFVRQSWGNQAGAVSLSEVRRVRETVR